jgi:hypothetical protein
MMTPELKWGLMLSTSAYTDFNSPLLLLKGDWRPSIRQSEEVSVSILYSSLIMFESIENTAQL